MQSVKQFEGSHTVLLYVTLYTIIWAHTELLSDIDNTQFLYYCTVQCVSPNGGGGLFGEDDRHIMFLISSISSYCFTLTKILSPQSFNEVNLGVSSTMLL